MEQELQRLRADLEALKGEFYRNNFSSYQDFNKDVSFNSRLKVPHYDTAPSTCSVGEIIEVGGVAKICSAANTWTTIGTQS